MITTLYVAFVIQFNIAKHFLGNRHIDKSFTVNDETIQAFRKYLEAQKIDYTEADLNDHLDWLKSNIRSEIFIAEFGQEEGLRVRAEADPQVLRALELLPRAKELAEGARKTIAERNGARGVTNP